MGKMERMRLRVQQVVVEAKKATALSIVDSKRVKRGKMSESLVKKTLEERIARIELQFAELQVESCRLEIYFDNEGICEYVLSIHKLLSKMRSYR